MPSVLQQNKRAEFADRALIFPEVEPTRRVCTLDTQPDCSIDGLLRTRSSANFAAHAAASVGSQTPLRGRRPMIAKPVDRRRHRPSPRPLVGNGSHSKADRPRTSLLFLTALCLSPLLSACDDYAMSPQRIKADRRTFYACAGFVRIHKETKSGRDVYSILFTDSRGVEKSLKAIKSLDIMPIPSRISVPMPASLPDPLKDKDDDGLPFKNGWTYTWPDGSAAKLVNGRWVPTDQRNPVCAPENS